MKTSDFSAISFSGNEIPKLQRTQLWPIWDTFFVRNFSKHSWIWVAYMNPWKHTIQKTAIWIKVSHALNTYIEIWSCPVIYWRWDYSPITFSNLGDGVKFWQIHNNGSDESLHPSTMPILLDQIRISLPLDLTRLSLINLCLIFVRMTWTWSKILKECYKS